MRDPQNLDDSIVGVQLIDGPISAAASGPQARELSLQGVAHLAGRLE